MKRRHLPIWLGVWGIVLLPALALGSGFAINEQSTRAIGKGGAVAAQADDPSAVYYNPAGIVQLDGTQVSTGLAAITPSATFTSNVTNSFLNTSVGRQTSTEDNTWMVPNLYITRKLTDQWSFGFGSFSNFGLGTEWPADWEGRYIVGGKNAQIKTLSLNPVVAYRPWQRLSVAAGPVLQYLDIKLENKIPTPGIDSNLKLTGDNWDWGWNAGLLFWITDEIRFGTSYRSRVKHGITGGETVISGAPLASLNQTAGAEADLELPAVAYFGLAYTIGPMTLEFDAQWTEWSTYDKLEAQFDRPLAALGGRTSISRAKGWDDVWAYRLGVEYRLNDRFDLRTGIIYDESPVPDETLDPLVPSGDRWLYTIGATFHHNRFSLDFAYNYLDDEGRTFNNAVGDFTAIGDGKLTGEFEDVDAHIFSLNLSYRF